MNVEGEKKQQELHEAIEKTIASHMREGQILGGWVVMYELIDLSGAPGSCGQMYGPREMTTWRALGLIEWVRRFCLYPDESHDDEDC